MRYVDFQGVARGVSDRSAFVFEPNVIGQLSAAVAPGDLVAHLRECERKISLSGRDVEDARAGFQNVGEKANRFAPPFFIGVGVAEMGERSVNFLEVVEVGRLPRLRPVFIEGDFSHDKKRPGKIGRRSRWWNAFAR